MFVGIIHSVYVEPKWELWMVCGLQLTKTVYPEEDQVGLNYIMLNTQGVHVHVSILI